MSDTDHLLLDHIDTPLGRLALIADTEGRLHAVGWVEGHDRVARLLRTPMKHARDPGGLSSALSAYFAGDLTAIDNLPVHLAGTAFQRAVWTALREIPCGQTRAYRDIAQHIGRPNAVRAVGTANGSNPVGVVVPCHRVVGANGTLTGYGGGLHRKRWLLVHEHALDPQAELPL